jgi:hypothetical protein
MLIMPRKASMKNLKMKLSRLIISPAEKVPFNFENITRLVSRPAPVKLAAC